MLTKGWDSLLWIDPSLLSLPISVYVITSGVIDGLFLYFIVYSSYLNSDEDDITFSDCWIGTGSFCITSLSLLVDENVFCDPDFFVELGEVAFSIFDDVLIFDEVSYATLAGRLRQSRL